MSNFAYIFKSSYEIHLAYPKQKYFHPDEVRDFYYLVGMYAKSTKNLHLLENAYNIVEQVGGQSRKSALLKSSILNIKYPKLHYLWFVLIISVILGVVLGVFWLIYKLGTWVF